MSLLIQLVVVICEIYIVLWILGFVLSLLNVGYRTAAWSPMGPNLTGSIGGLVVAIAIVIVLGHGGIFARG